MENNYENVEVVNEAEAPVETPVEVPVEAPVEAPAEVPVVQKLKNLPVKMIAILGGAAVTLIVLIVVLCSILSNTYKTPLNVMMDLANEKKASKMVDKESEILNGLCEKEYEAMMKIMQKSDDYDKEEVEEYYEEEIEEMKEEYGKNYKYSYKIEEKEKLEKDDLKQVKEGIKSYVKQLKDLLDELEDYDSDDWEEIADDMGLTKSQAKKLEGILEDVYKELKGVKVTKGYELTVTTTLKGSELDEPEEEEETIYVYKVNGRWVTDESLSMLRSFLYLFY